ncbi:MAG: hypothetical protein JXX29_18865 [Deltaproteobacteria bacterium]|nr:hypothetical protein [Deltaproteobacteria bacterium]MBN2673748.1 hypothetical protein [Deltaproteobacteria bacterium]
MCRQNLRYIRYAVAAALFASIVWGLAACSGCEPEDDEQAIRALVAQAAERAEKHDISGLFDLATQTFVANPGSNDRRSSKAMLMIMFRRYGAFHIAYPVFGVDIASSRLEADVSVPFVVVREGQTVPDIREFVEQPGKWLEEASKAADPFMLNAHLLKSDGEWKVDAVRITGRRSVNL